MATQELIIWVTLHNWYKYNFFFYNSQFLVVVLKNKTQGFSRADKYSRLYIVPVSSKKYFIYVKTIYNP